MDIRTRQILGRRIGFRGVKMLLFLSVADEIPWTSSYSRMETGSTGVVLRGAASDGQPDLLMEVAAD